MGVNYCIRLILGDGFRVHVRGGDPRLSARDHRVPRRSHRCPTEEDRRIFDFIAISFRFPFFLNFFEFLQAISLSN